MRKNISEAKWYCTYNPCGQCFDLYLVANLKKSMLAGTLPDRYYAKEIEFVKLSDCNNPSSPFLILEEDQAQALMDALWKGGLRPTEGHGSAGQIGAIEKHLEDMRKIVFDSFLIEVDSE